MCSSHGDAEFKQATNFYTVFFILKADLLHDDTVKGVRVIKVRPVLAVVVEKFNYA